MVRIDITKNELVPESEVLSKEDEIKLLENLNITKGQLPKLLKTDPMVKKIKAQTGQIIKINRASMTAGESLYYRVVVSG